nr:amidohydrolase [Eisenibacter elegans]
MIRPIPLLTLLFFWVCTTSLWAQSPVDKKIAQMADAIEGRMIEWRRDIHQNPELSNREFKTAEKVAAHLRSLGLEVHTGIAHTGVVGVLKGAKPGPTVGLRADMDALPVKERVDLPFASKAIGEYNGQEVGVMHACGHDTHVAILMAAADILSQLKNELSGTIVFVFQPAEEGPPPGEKGGAALMVEEGLIERFGLEVMFGLHINSATEVGTIRYKPEGIMAAADILQIKVKGKQTHGSTPWTGVDPVVAAAQIIQGLQTVVSRQTELTREAAVITIGAIHGGVRNNIIPEEVMLTGTIRTLNASMRDKLHADIHRTATKIAESSGAEAEVEIIKAAPLTYNQPELTAQMLPTLQRVAGADKVLLMNAVTGAEDFGCYGEKIPALFFFIGGMTLGNDPAKAPPHHTPDFYIDEAGMKTGLRALCHLALDYTQQKRKK